MGSSKNNTKHTNIQDHRFLIEKVFEMIDNPDHQFVRYSAGDEKQCRKAGYGKIKKNTIVLAEDAAVELGAPGTESVSMTLWTKTPGPSHGNVKGRLWISGGDLACTVKRSLSLLQCIVVELDEDADPFDPGLTLLKNLTGRIPGLMTLSIPEKQWIRIHKKLMKKKFSLHTMGECLFQTYRESLPNLKEIDIILAAGNGNLVSKFQPISHAAGTLSRDNRKLKWEKDGVVSCEELNCDVCDEKPACDTLKKIVSKRKNKK